MSTGQNLSYCSVGNSTPSPDQGSYDAGSYLSKVVGKSGYHKMPIYDKIASGEGLRSNLPSPKDLSLNSENFNGKQIYIANMKINFDYIENYLSFLKSYRM